MKKLAQRLPSPALVLLSVAAFQLPFFPVGAYLLMGLVALLALVKGTLLPAFLKVFRTSGLRWMVLLYVLYLAGMFFTSEWDTGLKELVSKIPYLLFPVLFCAVGTADMKKHLPRAFSAGVACVSIVLLAHAGYVYSLTGDGHVFFYERLTGSLHPTYFAFHVNFALLVLLRAAFPAGKNTKWAVAAYCFGIGILILTSARMAILTGLVTLTLFQVFLAWRERAMKVSMLVFLLFIPVAMFALVSAFSSGTNRFAEVNTYVESAKTTDEGSIPGRVKIWKSSLQLAGDHFFTGLGTGDVQKELHALYERENFQYALRLNLNAHNQYLQVFLAIGAGGLLVFLVMFFAPLGISFRNQEYLALAFLCVAGMNALTESLLEREAGVLWFAFFYSLYFSPAQDEPVRVP